jgi:hypothetical protein
MDWGIPVSPESSLTHRWKGGRKSLKQYIRMEDKSIYNYLAEQLDKAGIGYLHLVDHSAMGAPLVPLELKKQIRKSFKNTIILSCR